jgi:hypothetical protein
LVLSVLVLPTFLSILANLDSVPTGFVLALDVITAHAPDHSATGGNE